MAVFQLLLISFLFTNNGVLGGNSSALSSLRWPRLDIFHIPDNTDSSHGELRKRDACSDAFGTGWTDSTCTPGNTLCCVNHNQTYPQCQQYLGLGFCCVGLDEGCYVDLTSACGQPGAVNCPQSLLAEGVDEVCCPEDTTCATQYTYHPTWVRCNIQQTAIQSLAASTSTLSGAVTASSGAIPETLSRASTTSSSTSSSNPSGQTSTSTQTPLSAGSAEEKEPVASLTGGDIAGIAIGPVAALVIIAGLAWLCWRRRAKKKQQPPAYSQTSAPPSEAWPHYRSYSPMFGYGAPSEGQYASELDEGHQQELAGGLPGELQSNKSVRNIRSPVHELESTDNQRSR